MCYWILFSWLKIILSPFIGFILLIWLFHNFWVLCSFHSSYTTSGENTLWGLKEPSCLLLIGSACAWAFTFTLIGKLAYSWRHHNLSLLLFGQRHSNFRCFSFEQNCIVHCVKPSKYSYCLRDDLLKMEWQMLLAYVLL